ncbi:phage tail tape measure protein [Flavobacterium columnare]|uniref:phage tail tape measure protein n=1 Tax=Flavobacterium columnare TaxID=996 RepID=UPI0040347F88
MSSVLPFNLQFSTNATSVIGGINNSLNEVQNASNNTTKSLGDCYKSLLSFSLAFEGINQIKDGLNELLKPGITLNSQMSELSAITNVTGDALDRIESAARSTAKTFGTDASANVESYKLILSQLDPAIAKNAEAMKMMGNNVNVLSKSMGGDTVAATNVLTTAMNQFGVSTENPIAAAKVMADMMNVMAAGAQVGSAELPQIQSALEQVGMVAKTTGLSFVETNAQIQLLDKSGKKGAEGGVALRNVLTTLSEGRFASKDATEGLKQLGISTVTLADASIPLTDRLRMLRPVMNDTALMTKVFGKENMAAGIAMIKGADQADVLAKQITNTNSAVDQANVVMGSYQEQMNRWKAKIEDLKISFFNLTESIMPYTQQAFNAISVMGQMAVSLNALSSVTGAFKTHIWGKIFATNADTVATNTNTVSMGIGGRIAHWYREKIMSINAQMTIGAIASRIYSSATNSVRNAMLGATGGVRAFSAAIMSIPVIGWIIAAVMAVIVIVKLLWDHSKRFREILFGIWEAAKAVFHNIGVVIGRVWQFVKPIFLAHWEVIKMVFGKIWDFIKWVFNGIVSAVKWVFQATISVFDNIKNTAIQAFQGFKKAFSFFIQLIDEWLLQPLKNAFGCVWDWIVSLFEKIMAKLSKVFAPVKKLLKSLFSTEGMTDVTVAYKQGEKKGAKSYDEDHPKAKKKAKAKKNAPSMDVAGIFDVTKGGIPKTKTIGSDSAKTVKEKNDAKGSSGKTVGNLNITKLVESINIYNQNGMAMDKQAIVNAIKEALLTGVADYSLGLES